MHTLFNTMALDGTDKKAIFEQIYRQHYYKVVHFAYHYINDPMIAESIAQEVFANLWSHMDNVDLNRNVVAYLLTSAKHRSLNILSKQNYRDRYSQQTSKELQHKINNSLLEDDVTSKLLQTEVSSILSRSYEAMPEKIRDTFIMCRIKGYKHKDAARILNVSEKTIEYRIAKAMLIIRKYFREYLSLIVLLMGAILTRLK